MQAFFNIRDKYKFVWDSYLEQVSAAKLTIHLDLSDVSVISTSRPGQVCVSEFSRKKKLIN